LSFACQCPVYGVVGFEDSQVEVIGADAEDKSICGFGGGIG
jgi:hypothetical protein